MSFGPLYETSGCIAPDPLVRLYRPPETTSPKASSSDNAKRQPRIIVIGGWTDARDAHLAKYTAKYHEMYPAAEILLLKSTTNQILNPSSIASRGMSQAASFIRSAIPQNQDQPSSSSSSSSSSSPELLIHIFSNGGSSNLANLYQFFVPSKRSRHEDQHLPPHVTIYDSCPGVFSVPHVVAFFNVGLSPVLRLVAAPLLYIAAMLMSILMILGVVPDSLSDWGKAHNHQGNESEVRRVYIYSPTDALIDYKAVEAHAADARVKGFDVALERYEGSAHVAHARKDEQRYWEIVRRTFEGS